MSAAEPLWGHDHTGVYLHVWRLVDGRWVRQRCAYCARARSAS